MYLFVNCNTSEKHVSNTSLLKATHTFTHHLISLHSFAHHMWLFYYKPVSVGAKADLTDKTVKSVNFKSLQIAFFTHAVLKCFHHLFHQF